MKSNCWIQRALIAVVWLLASISAYCFWNPGLHDARVDTREANPLNATVKANPSRFCQETDLLYYGYRYYNASTGRWINRDPLSEPGFEPIAKKPKNRTRVPGELRLRKALADLRATNPTLAMNISSEYPELRGDPEAEFDPIASTSPYTFVQNDPLSKVDVLGLTAHIYYHYCWMMCPCRAQVGIVTAWTLWPVPDAVNNRCCKATSRFFCSTVMPPGTGNYTAALAAAEIYYQGCVIFPRP